MRALWKDQVLAESAQTVVVEGNHYFPPESVRWDLLVPTSTTTQCHWKGTAHYWSVASDPDAGADVVWAYPEPMDAARNITGHAAFWRGVVVEES